MDEASRRRQRLMQSAIRRQIEAQVHDEILAKADAEVARNRIEHPGKTVDDFADVADFLDYLGTATTLAEQVSPPSNQKLGELPGQRQILPCRCLRSKPQRGVGSTP
jgi:hypothetical protein